MSAGLPMMDPAFLAALEAGPGPAAPTPAGWAGAEPELAAAYAAMNQPPAPPPGLVSLEQLGATPVGQAPQSPLPAPRARVRAPEPAAVTSYPADAQTTALGPPAPTETEAQAAQAIPESGDVLQRLDAIGADEAKLEKQREATARAAADIERQKAQVDADHAQEESALNTKHKLELDQAQAKSAERMRLAQAEEDAAIAERRNFKFQDYWADKSTGNKVLAGISMALGAMGASLSHGQNYAAQIIDGAISRDFEMQKARAASMDDRVAMARTGIKDADAARASLEREVDLRHAAALEEVKGKIEAEKAKLGPAAVSAKLDATIATLQESRDNVRRQAVMDRDKIETERAHNLIERQKADTEAMRWRHAHGAGGGGAAPAGGLPKPPKGFGYVTDGEGNPVRLPDGKYDIRPEKAAESRSKFLADQGKAATKAAAAGPKDADFAVAIGALNDFDKELAKGATVFGAPERHTLQRALETKLAPVMGMKSGLTSRNQKILDELVGGEGTLGAVKRMGGWGRGEIQALKEDLIRGHNRAIQASRPPAAAPAAIDQEAVKWARANPKDARSAQILRANGMSPTQTER